MIIGVYKIDGDRLGSSTTLYNDMFIQQCDGYKLAVLAIVHTILGTGTHTDIDKNPQYKASDKNTQQIGFISFIWVRGKNTSNTDLLL